MNRRILILLVIIAVLFLALLLSMIFDLGMFIFWIGGLLAVAGIVLIIDAARNTKAKSLKVFLIITGAASAGIIISAVLHNLVFALMVSLGSTISDEPVFFILATIILPLALVAGLIGSFIQIHKFRPVS